jgi:hypothetical protein
MARALLAALILLAAFPVTAAAARDPVDHSKPKAPDGTPICAAWVHDRYTVEARGKTWPTWHPPVDSRYRCAFGHEHGTNPRAFRYFRRTGMPAFGRTATFAGHAEPHAGFKVFATNDDRRGLAWMMVLHQGSGSPKRATVRHHSLDIWLFRARGGRLIAQTRHMADFGRTILNCPGADLPRSWRLLPYPGCGSVYEEWDTALRVGGALRGNPGFAIDNPITQFDPANPEAIVFNKRRACGPHDPAGWDSYCKGDKRTVLHPAWVVRNRRAARFRTNAYGRRAKRGIPQFVSRRVRVNQRGERKGVENTFVMERTTDGGLYRPGRGFHSANFERGYCLLRAN